MNADKGQAVEAERSLFYEVFKACSLGIALENLEGQLLFVNPALCTMLGFSEDEMRNRHCFEFSPPEDAANDWALFEQLRAGSINNYQIEKRFFQRDGSLVWGRLTVSLLDGTHALVVAMVEDITERKKAKEALQKSEERFRLATQAGKMYAYQWDVATDIIVRSANVASVLGSTSEASLTRQQLFDRVHPDDRSVFDAPVSQCTPEHPDVQMSYRMLRPDGSVVWVEKTAHAFFDEARRLVRMIGMVADITERKQAEDALRKSEERFRLAAQAGKMFAYEWDVTTDVIVCSPEAAQILRINEGERVSGQQVLAKVHLGDRQRVMDAIAALSPEKPILRINYRMVRPDGTMIWVEQNSRAHFDERGRMFRVVGMVADITERKVAEEGLRTSEERLRLAQSVAGIGTFERDIRTGVNTWTTDLESMYGLPPGGFGKTLAAFEDLIHPDDRAEVVKLVDRALRTGEPANGEWRVIWPDGSVHWLAGRWRVLMDESGEPLRVVGVDMDITERKHAEEALSDVARKLVEAQEQERARIGRELHDDVCQRLALLAVEIGQIQERQHDLTPDTLNWMRELARRATELSSDIQSLSHELHSSKLELLGVAGGMRSWCREFGSRRKMEIDFKSHDVPNVPQEISLCLFRVMQEAVNNADKHSGVKRIEVQLHEESGAIHLIVSDSGKGFDVAAVQQSDGLGLTSMRERVRLVNGTIAIESKPMTGTTIHVRAPIVSNQIAQKLAG